MGTISYKSDDEYSTISEKGDIGFVDFDKYKSACSYNPNEESNVVVISVPFALIEGKPKSGFVGERVVDSVTIENTTNETLELWSIKIYDSKPEDSFTLSLMKPPTDCSDVQYIQEFMESFSLEDRMLRPGQKLTVWLTCKPKEIGLHTSAVHFNVGDDTIERLVFVLAEDKVSQSLASSRPFHRERRKKVPAVDVSAANGIVVGSRPTRASNRGFRCILPKYTIPKDLREMIEQKQFPDVIGEGLRRDNYIAYFRTLLAIEEIKMEEDMRDYDMESVTMTRRGPQFLSLDVPGLAEKRPSLVYGDYVIARVATADASEIIIPYQGYIHRVEAEEVYLKFDRDFHINHVAGNLYNVQFAFNRMGVRRLHQAIEATESLNGEVLFPSGIARARNIEAARLAPMSCMLNEEQTRAVEKILGCKGGAPYVIHGPPGTGKTRTLIEAIIQINIMRKDARVLACAPSNSAADHILEKLVGQRNVNMQDHEILRLNALTRPSDDVNPSYTRFCNVEDNGFKCPLLRDLRRYRIIISTYASASLLYAEGIKRGHFSHIFLDEAGQASEPETMIPLSHLLKKETVVVLAGDPRQLGPIVFSKDAENYGLGTSYLERLFECKLYGALNKNYATILVRNYRCHPIILHLPSEMFYGGELIPCKEDDTSTRTWVDLLPNKEFPLLFIGIQGCDEREGNNPSWFNRIEASKVVEIIRDLIENKGLKMEDIGVITPYRQQVLKIRSALESFDWANIKVGSVEQFQGQEREVIIISTVRSTIQHNDFDRIHYLGFLSNPRRFNVAVTRARSLLVVIGNPHIICKDPYWNKLLWYCVDNGSYKGCFLPEKLEIPQEDSRQENNWGCDEAGQAKNWCDDAGQANNWCDDGGQVNNWGDDGGQVNNWGDDGEQAYNCHDDGAQENNWDCGGAQAKSWGCEGAQANDWDRDQDQNQGEKVNDWDQDEGAQAKNQITVHQTDYTLDPVIDEAEWSDGWK